jgi:hypothetical protein
MAWARCPDCGKRDIERIDSADEVMRRYSVTRRSYSCSCGWSCWTSERVTCVRPPTLYLRAKYAVDFERDYAPSAACTPVTSDT